MFLKMNTLDHIPEEKYNQILKRVGFFRFLYLEEFGNPLSEYSLNYKDNLNLVLESCRIGDVLFMKRSNDMTNFWTALQKITGNNYTHTLIVSSVDPVKIIHATLSKENGKAGIEEINLNDYIEKQKDVEMLSCRLSEGEGLVDFIRSDIFPYDKYDRYAAIFDILVQRNIGSSRSWNCVELVGHSLAKTLSQPEKRYFSHSVTPDDLLAKIIVLLPDRLESIYSIKLIKNEF